MIFDVIKNFTTMVKIKVFTKEDDLLDDVFQQKSTLGEILHMAQIQFDQGKLQEFNHTENRYWKMSHWTNCRLNQ